MTRAEHHANRVDEIALGLIGAIIWKKDPTTAITVGTREGEMKNVLHVHLGGQPYTFSYNHGDGCIEMRRGAVSGETVAQFSDETSMQQLKDIFNRL